MPLIFNGVTIPENVANALTVNGADIHDVYFNGVQVWHQSLINITGWSGDSTFVSASGPVGFDASGMNIRAFFDYTGGEQGVSSYAPWVSATSQGVFSGGGSAFGDGVFLMPLQGSGNTINGSVIFNPSTETFTGSYYSHFNTYWGEVDYLIETSGGLLRYRCVDSYGYYSGTGPWISLN